MGWHDIFEEVRKHTNPEGQKYVDMGKSQLAPVDKALKNGDMMGALKIARKCMPYLKAIIPHVNKESLQEYLKNTSDRIEKFIGQIEKQGPTMFALNHFFSAESKGLSGILGKLLKAVVSIVNNVGHAVGGVVHDVGGLVGGLAHSLKLKV